MEKALQQRHLNMEVNLNTYMMCMTNHLGISMLKMIYPEARVDGLSRECLITLGLGGDRRRRLLRSLEEVDENEEEEEEVPTLPEPFQLQIEFPDGTTFSSSPTPIEEDNEESSGASNTPATASMHEMIKQIYESMIVSTSNGSNSSPLNDSFVSDSNAQWYVDWVSIGDIRLYSCLH